MIHPCDKLWEDRPEPEPAPEPSRHGDTFELGPGEVYMNGRLVGRMKSFEYTLEDKPCLPKQGVLCNGGPACPGCDDCSVSLSDALELGDVHPATNCACGSALVKCGAEGWWRCTDCHTLWRVGR